MSLFGLVIARKNKPTYLLDYLQPMTENECRIFRSKMTSFPQQVIHIVRVKPTRDTTSARWEIDQPMPIWKDL